MRHVIHVADLLHIISLANVAIREHNFEGHDWQDRNILTFETDALRSELTDFQAGKRKSYNLVITDDLK